MPHERRARQAPRGTPFPIWKFSDASSRMTETRKAQPAAQTPAIDPKSEIPSFAELAADPEIAALLDFDPVALDPRPNGWDAQAQRALVALSALTGSKDRAARAIGRKTGGLKRIFEKPDGAAFESAVDAALDLYRRRHGIKLVHGLTAAAAARSAELAAPAPLDDHGKAQQPGQVMNELGAWEDEESMRRRAEEARDSIASKLLRIRRLYLQEISGDAGKRAAFEILTELPIDWEKAARLEPQPDEPWNRANQRQPDMILTAESGWTFGEHGYGPDRKAQARKAIDERRAAEGLEPVDWGE